MECAGWMDKFFMYVHITTCSTSVFLCFVAFIIIGVEWMDGILEFLLILEGKGMGMDFPWGGGVLGVYGTYRLIGIVS